MKYKSIFIIFLSVISQIIPMETNTSFEKEAKIKGILENSIKFESYITSHNDVWATVKEFQFHYKSSLKNMESNNTYQLANAFSSKACWGQIAIYSLNAKICFDLGSFTDSASISQSATLFSVLQYEYVPMVAQPYAPYFIVEKVTNARDTQTEGRGYSQACLKYFLDEFVIQCTRVKYVFSDLRNPICQHYFPKYGFQLGMIEEFKDHKFSRPLEVSSFWVRK